MAKRPDRVRGSAIYAAGLCVLAGILSAGCSDAVIRQYSKLGQWTAPSDAPVVISGNPKADLGAYQSSCETLSEADWEVLEKIAPRPIWERIDESRRQARANQARRAATAPAARAAATTREATTAPATTQPKIPTGVAITELPGGRRRIVYTLRHFGGSTAESKGGETTRRTIDIKPVDLGPFVRMVAQGLGDQGSCEILPSQNALVITFNAGATDTVLQLLADLDRPARQVEITARIFEIKHDFDFQLGANLLLNHLAGSGSQELSSTFSARAFLDSLSNPGLGASAYQGSALHLIQTFGNSGMSLDATFQALADTGLIKEVASPRMTVLAGRTGYMLAGQEIPVQAARITNAGVVTERTTYRPIGVQLYITPQTIGTESVKLHVLTVVSAIAGFNPRMSLEGWDSLQATVNPTFDSREAETTVTVGDGNTLVIGGLRTVRHITRERKIPGLGDLWGIEWLFKNHRSQRQINDLYFFITPQIIQ